MLLCRSADVDVNVVPLLRDGMKAVGGGGGGRPDFAQGGGRSPEGIGEARNIIKKGLERILIGPE